MGGGGRGGSPSFLEACVEGVLIAPSAWERGSSLHLVLEEGVTPLIVEDRGQRSRYCTQCLAKAGIPSGEEGLPCSWKL